MLKSVLTFICFAAIATAKANDSSENSCDYLNGKGKFTDGNFNVNKVGLHFKNNFYSPTPYNGYNKQHFVG